MKNATPPYILTAEKILLCTYFVLIVMSWISFLNPSLYEEYFYISTLHNTLMNIGGFLFFLFLTLIVLHILNVFKTDKKILFISIFLICCNLFLIYLQITKQGDS